MRRATVTARPASPAVYASFQGCRNRLSLETRSAPLTAQVADLKAMCKERNITGYSKYRKSQLVRVLKDAMLVEME